MCWCYEQKNIVTVNHDFDFTFFGFFNQALKTAVHTIAHVNVADAVLAFGFAHMESTVAGRRELVSDVDNTVLHIQVVNGKDDELADAQPGAKQNVVWVVLFTENRVILYKSKERNLLFFYQSNCTALVVCSVFFSAYLKGILTDDVILTGLIESKAYDAQIPTYGTGFFTITV